MSDREEFIEKLLRNSKIIESAIKDTDTVELKAELKTLNYLITKSAEMLTNSIEIPSWEDAPPKATHRAMNSDGHGTQQSQKNSPWAAAFTGTF